MANDYLALVYASFLEKVIIPNQSLILLTNSLTVFASQLRSFTKI